MQLGCAGFAQAINEAGCPDRTRDDVWAVDGLIFSVRAPALACSPPFTS
jgi:hypothetical protein